MLELIKHEFIRIIIILASSSPHRTEILNKTVKILQIKCCIKLIIKDYDERQMREDDFSSHRNYSWAVAEKKESVLDEITSIKVIE